MSGRHSLNLSSLPAAVILAACLVLAGMVSTKAEARPGTDVSVAGVACSYGTFNIFAHRNFGGAAECFDRNGGNVRSAITNQISSLSNGLNVTMCAYDGPNRTGYSLAVGPGSYYRNLAWDGAPDGRSWNDRIESIGPAPC